jgi:hypothetical protein
VGEKIHIVVRRLFEEDLRRTFIGEVVDAGDSCLRLSGYAYSWESVKGVFVRLPGLRTRVFSMADAINVITVLPSEAEIDNVHYVVSQEEGLLVTDDKAFSANVREF